MSKSGMMIADGPKWTTTIPRLDDIEAKIDRIDHKLNLLLTALENVRVLSTVRDESGDVIGINAVVAPPMLETGIK